ncbi:hypothetical protein [Acrocarpospora catenulata]|uniref:hypothetical protein n=1 Tax=Acrocarpospora catenulata TaxID=2836182 RepID=UPI001BDA8944|nr:hypothetical protein [Acrocarpospora catenulata]
MSRAAALAISWTKAPRQLAEPSPLNQEGRPATPVAGHLTCEHALRRIFLGEKNGDDNSTATASGGVVNGSGDGDREPFDGRSNSQAGQQIYMSTSVGNDPTRWVAANHGQMFIESTKGMHAVRDPSIVRSPEGDRFYLIATDLNVDGRAYGWRGASGGLDARQRLHHPRHDEHDLRRGADGGQGQPRRRAG